VHPSTRSTAVLFLIGSLLLAPAAVAPSVASEADPVVEVLQPVSTVPGTAIVDGPFDMIVQVTGGVPHDLTLTPWLPSWAASSPTADPVTIPAGSCPESCSVSWRLNPASQTTPWYPGFARLDVDAVMDGRSIQTYGNGVNYQPVVQPTRVAGTEATATPNTAGGGPEVFDSGGWVTFSGLGTRAADEQVQVSVLTAAGDLSATPLLSAAGFWSQEPDPDTGYAVGRAQLNTSALPEGRYRLVAQAHDSAGRWSYASPGSIVVVHSPPVTVRADDPGMVAAGQPITVRVEVRGLRSPAPRPGTVRLTMNGTVSEYPADLTDWYVPRDTTKASTRVIAASTAGLPVGAVDVVAEVLDVGGKSIGRASTSIKVIDFRETVTVPALVVGRSASVRLRATAPTGTALLQCFVSLQSPLKQDFTSNLCPGPRATSVDRNAVFVPQNAGTGVLRAEIMAHDGVIGPQRDVRVTVYANRTATLAAPARASWGTVQTATVTVLDEKRVGLRSPAAAGLTVTLQRKKAGSSTWTSIGTAVIGSTGKATIRYTNAASGRLRALVKGTVPGSTVASAERSTTSVAVVAWSSLPTSARYGSVVTAGVYAKPHEKGALVRFQARKLGTATWKSFGSGAVGTSGYAKASARLPSKGTWEVRIQRAGTTAQATGYSTVRRIKVT
jgi:hypothetical protein